ncbi:c-type cytochrome [Rhodobacterales bacterium LSUCC0387]|nr:c-type cytochrome [Rhodobacterales bacterium LSUCC0387]
MGKQGLFAFAVIFWAMQSSPALSEGDPMAGQAAFRLCAACHMIGDGAINRAGPHLDDLMGRPVGGLSDYRYSDTLTEAGNEGELWTEDRLNSFLEDPQGYYRGTRMVFRGISDPNTRADLVAYIVAEADNYDRAATATSTGDMPPEIAAILAIQGDYAYGEYLSSECTACHATQSGGDIPSIVGLAPSTFVHSLISYKIGQREHQVMTMIANRLGDEEIAALAAYFTTVE